jgi:hypothetical protein
MHRLFRELAFGQLCQGFTEWLNIACRRAPFEFATFGLAARIKGFFLRNLLKLCTFFNFSDDVLCFRL